MITLILTYRNRDLSIVKRCLDSLKQQISTNFVVYLVDYGSHAEYLEALKKIQTNYPFLTLTKVPVEYQLWNKSKAINIALKGCNTPYCFVGDIDMIFRKDFIGKLNALKNDNEVTYFQVGFLTQGESLKNKPFNDYALKHITGKDATGMTLYPTPLLKSINGYDEFYHGWGAEDSDVHARLRHKGIPVHFYTEDTLILHQWHSRGYRSEHSTEPFHSTLEQINHQYYQQVLNTKRIQANQNFSWGEIHDKISFSTCHTLSLTNEQCAIDAFLMGQLQQLSLQQVQVTISKDSDYKTLKHRVKKLLGKTHKAFYSLQEVNDKVLLVLIASHRNRYYEYIWDKNAGTIQLKLDLS